MLYHSRYADRNSKENDKLTALARRIARNLSALLYSIIKVHLLGEASPYLPDRCRLLVCSPSVYCGLLEVPASLTALAFRLRSLFTEATPFLFLLGKSGGQFAVVLPALSALSLVSLCYLASPCYGRPTMFYFIKVL